MIEEEQVLTDEEWEQVKAGTYIEPEAKIDRDLSRNMGGTDSDKGVGTKVTAQSLNETAAAKWATSDKLRAEFEVKEEAFAGDPKTTNEWYDAHISSLKADMDALEAQKAFHAYDKNKGGINVVQTNLDKLKSDLSTAEEDYAEIKAGTYAWVESGDQWHLVPTPGGSPTVPTSGESFAPEATEEQKAQLRDYQGIDERFRRPATPQGDTSRMPPESRTFRMLSLNDLLEISKNPILPERIRSFVSETPGPILEQKYGRNYLDNFGSMSQAQRLNLLLDAKEAQRGRREFGQDIRTAAGYVGEVAEVFATEVAPRAAAFGLGSIAAPGIGGVAGLAAYEAALPWIKEKYGDAEAFLARVERLEETEQEVKNLRKELDALKSERSGSPVTPDDSPDTGPKKGRPSVKENPDGSIDL